MLAGAGHSWKGELMANDENRLRKASEPPFCWQHKPALRKIREAFDQEKTVSSALGIYGALTEIASDEESEVFQTTHAYIAQKSGFSPRTVQARLAGLAEIGLVEVSTPSMKTPSTYRLLSVLSVQQPLPSDTQPLPSVRQRTKKAPLPSSEESKKNVYEESKEECGATAPAPSKKTRFVPPALNEVKAKAKELGLPDIEAEEFFNYNVSVGWKVSGKPMVDWEAALRNKKIRYEKWKNGKAPHTTTDEHEKGF